MNFCKKTHQKLIFAVLTEASERVVLHINFCTLPNKKSLAKQRATGWSGELIARQLSISRGANYAGHIRWQRQPANNSEAARRLHSTSQGDATQQ
jgi:hypothetical protein